MSRRRIGQSLRKLLAVGFCVTMLLSLVTPARAGPGGGGPLPAASLTVTVISADGSPIEIVEPGKTTVIRVKVEEKVDGMLQPLPGAAVLMDASWDVTYTGAGYPLGYFAATTRDDGCAEIALRPSRAGSYHIVGAALDMSGGPGVPPEILAWGDTLVFALGPSDGLGIVKVTAVNAGEADATLGFVPPERLRAQLSIGENPFSGMGANMSCSMLAPAYEPGKRETGVLTVRGEGAGSSGLVFMKQIALPEAGEMVTAEFDLADLAILEITRAIAQGPAMRVWYRSDPALTWGQYHYLVDIGSPDTVPFFVLKNDLSEVLVRVDSPGGAGDFIVERQIGFGTGNTANVEFSESTVGLNKLMISARSWTDCPNLVCYVSAFGQQFDISVEGGSESLYVTPAAAGSPDALTLFSAERGPYTFYPPSQEGKGLEIRFSRGEASLNLGEGHTGGEPVLETQDVILGPEPFVGIDTDGDSVADEQRGYTPGSRVYVGLPLHAKFEDASGNAVKLWESKSGMLDRNWNWTVEKRSGEYWIPVVVMTKNPITGDNVFWDTPILEEGGPTSALYRLTVYADLGPAYPGDPEHQGMTAIYRREVPVGVPAPKEGDTETPAVIVLKVIPADQEGPIIEGDTVTMQLWAHWVPGSETGGQRGLSGVDMSLTYPKSAVVTVPDSWTPVSIGSEGEEHTFFPGHWLGDVCEIVDGQHQLDMSDPACPLGKHYLEFDQGTPIYPELVTTDAETGSFRYVRYLTGDEPCSAGSGMIVQWEMELLQAAQKIELLPSPSSEEQSFSLDLAGFDLANPADDPYTIPYYAVPSWLGVAPRLGPVTIDSGFGPVPGWSTVLRGTGTPGVGVRLQIERPGLETEYRHVPVNESGDWKAMVWSNDAPSCEVFAFQEAYGQTAASGQVPGIYFDPNPPTFADVSWSPADDGEIHITGRFVKGDGTDLPDSDVLACWALIDPPAGLVLTDEELSAIPEGGLAIQVFLQEGAIFALDVPATSENVVLFARDEAGNQSSFEVGLTTQAADTTAPIATLAAPSPLTDVSVHTQILITFNEPVPFEDGARPFYFRLWKGVPGEPSTIQVTGGVLWTRTVADSSWLFTPVADLTYGTLYTVEVQAYDDAGNQMPAKVAWTFTTEAGSGADTTNPTLLALLPSSGSADAAVGSNIELTFSEAMRETGFVFTLTPQGGAAVTGQGSWTDGGTVYTFDPAVDLQSSKVYTVAVDGADVAGNPLDGDKVFTFTTEVIVGARVYLEPAVKSVGTNTEFTVDVMVADVQNLAGCSFEVHFDPAILSVVDSNAGTPDVVEISNGSIFAGKSPIVTPNEVDNGAGTIKYSVLVTSSGSTFSGSGSVASIRFVSKDAETELPSAVGFYEESDIAAGGVVLGVPGGGDIPVVSKAGTAVTVVRGGIVRGIVKMEKMLASDPDPDSPQANHGGITIQLMIGQTVAMETTSAADGRYEFSGVPDGTYTVRYFKPGWSVVKRANKVVAAGSALELPGLVLVLGDMNGDGYINVLDLLWMAGNIGSRPNLPNWSTKGVADCNRDTFVNVLDLLRAAKNIGVRPQ